MIVAQIVPPSSDYEMAERIRASWVERQRTDDAARAILGANKAARVASLGNATPEALWYAILLRVKDLSLGTPDDWQGWVNGELYRAYQEYQHSQKVIEAAIAQEFREKVRERASLHTMTEQQQSAAYPGADTGGTAGKRQDAGEEESA